ncbi:gamma-glutamyl-gamma-aminobutyrate hydrolase family protein [Candidatus Sumerlaeota bacterium]|nr:gamma-glutamyl-gamma-aminobutyrate hydrolase family protein [Candidatus Sumerlaeota bacterium]
MPPVIGLNSGLSVDQKGTPSFSLGGDYTNAVFKAGGIPVILPATKNEDVIDTYFKKIDGLILVGGPDLDPALYGESNKLATVQIAPPLRQEFSLFLAREAITRDIPLLGICMGCQVLNVALGGSLYQDIEYELPGYSVRHFRKINSISPFHKIAILPDSLLYRILEKTEMEVNSYHHQSVRNPGEGLKATAYSEDGIVECIERPDKRFALGVQWHPEVIHEREEQLSLFRALVSASSGRT